jgi:glutamine amidotransferase
MSAVIIDYGMGNVASVQKALNYLKIEANVSDDPKEIEESKFILLPGVGSFNQGITNLQKNGLYTVLTEQVVNRKKPFLGICLGMQLIATNGTEPVPTKGLGWVQGNVIEIKTPGLRVPHLGWNTIKVKDSNFFDGVNNQDFYFIHSFHFDVTEKDTIAATVDYGGELVACIQKENIFATQFHPEKSQDAGLKLLRNFFEQNA